MNDPVTRADVTLDHFCSVDTEPSLRVDVQALTVDRYDRPEGRKLLGRHHARYDVVFQDFGQTPVLLDHAPELFFWINVRESAVVSKKVDLFDLYIKDPEKADRLVFRRIPNADRRGFMRGAGLATMAAMLGGFIPFHRNMPSGFIPTALAEEPLRIEGKDGLVIPNDRPHARNAAGHEPRPLGRNA